MTEQEQKDLANGKYNRIMNEVVSLKEKRNKLITATCERLQSIIESNSDSVNEFDSSGIEHPLSMLNATHKQLIERVNALNECAEMAGKPRIRISHATFRYLGIS